MPYFVGVMDEGSRTRAFWLVEHERSLLWFWRLCLGLVLMLLFYSIDYSCVVEGLELSALVAFFVL